MDQSVTEEAECYFLCEEDSHSQERPCASNEPKDQTVHSQGRHCAYRTKVPEPSDPRKHIIIEMATVKAALPISVPSVMPMEEGFWQPIPKAARHECELKPLFDACTEDSSTQTSCSRTRWSSMWPKIEADNDRTILPRTRLEFRYLVGDAYKGIKQDATHADNFNTLRLIQGHSGAPEVKPKVFTLPRQLVFITQDLHTITVHRSTRTVCFFSANNSLPEASDVSTHVPRW